jgi:ketosteroid isomerase-like protein
MSEESTTPGLVELTRRTFDAYNRRDFDMVMSFYGPDSVWDASPWGLGTFEGWAVVRRFFEDWIGSYEEFEIEPEEVLDLGSGVVFAMFCHSARPTGSTGRVRLRQASVFVWAKDVIVRATSYRDIDEARAAAERLAESRG